MRFLYFLILLLLVLSCKLDTKQKSTQYSTLQLGDWRATLDVKDNEQLPFTFSVNSNNTWTVYNDTEKITVEDITISGDSISIQFPVYEGVIKGTFTPTSISGSYIKPSLDRIVPFKATYGKQKRFAINKKPTIQMTGSWETTFSPNTADAYIAKGIFTQKNNKLSGTFRTTTGDYRYLEGVVNGNTFKLSTFDGAHAFLFTGQVIDSTLQGTFYSGNHFKEPFSATLNNTYELPDDNTLTYIKDGYNGLAFSFPNSNGDLISLDDENLKGKVRVIQIMGTWCPNCLDETRYYTSFYNNNKSEGLEFIALAFEYAPTQEVAFKSIQRLKDDVGVPYPILLAQYGSADKKTSQEKLPMLNHILSYPTTIFVDKKGAVRKIHTGFNGPATGEKYIEFKKEFEEFVKTLQAEDV